MPKLGDRALPGEKVLEAAIQNLDILLCSLDVEALRKDVELLEALYLLVIAIAQIQDALHDT